MFTVTPQTPKSYDNNNKLTQTYNMSVVVNFILTILVQLQVHKVHIKINLGLMSKIIRALDVPYFLGGLAPSTELFCAIDPLETEVPYFHSLYVCYLYTF